MPIIKLTQSSIATLQLPPGKARIEWVDADTGGMYLLQTPTAATYFYRHKVAGKLKHHKLGRSSDITLADARKGALLLKAQQANGNDTPAVEIKPVQTEITFTDFFNDHYLPYVKPRKRSWERDEELFRLRVQAEFGAKPLNQITRQQIQLFHTQLLEKGLAPATCDHHVKFLKHALNLAIDWNLLTEKNPAARIPLFNVDNRVEHPLSQDELEKLLNLLRTDKNRVVCLVIWWLMSVGCRLSEALGAKWNQIDKENKVWRIPARNSKSKRIRSVPLNDSAMDILAQLDTENTSEFLFVSPKTKQSLGSIMKVWSRLRAKIGITHRLHDLRHFHASGLVCSGVPIYEVKSILGHANIVTTERYCLLSNSVLAKASKSIDTILKGAMQEETA